MSTDYGPRPILLPRLRFGAYADMPPERIEGGARAAIRACCRGGKLQPDAYLINVLRDGSGRVIHSFGPVYPMEGRT